MIEKTGGALSEYFSVVKDMIPLFLITATLAFTVGLHFVKQSYLQRTFSQMIGNLVFSSFIAAMMAICIICLAELIFPTISVKIELGIAVFVGLFGVKGIDALLRKKFDLRVVDLMDPDEIPLMKRAAEEKKKKKGKHGKRKPDDPKE